MRRLLLFAVPFCLLGAACSGDDQGPVTPRPPVTPKPPTTSRPGLHVISGGGVTDTVDAILPGELVVELRDQHGDPRAGVPVRFFSVYAPSAGQALLARPEWTGFDFGMADTTDASGRASARVRLGRYRGEARVVAEVIGDSLTRAQTAYMVEPGAPASLSILPRDTTLYVGRSYALSTVVRDRYGHPRTDAVRYSALVPAEARASEGGLVETVGVGRGKILVSAGQLSDTAHVSIPPEAVITAVGLAGSGNGYRVQIVAMNLDGSGRTAVVSSEAFSDAGYSWNRDGSALVFGYGDHDTNLFVRSAAGDAPLLKAAAPLQSLAYPRHSRDGAWIYFNGRPGHQNCEIWRVRADGTGAERVGPAVDYYQRDVSPDPSPDGTRVAYSTSRVHTTMPVIRIVTLATRTVSNIDVPGVTPRWSPDGSRIAYVTTKPSWGYLDDSRAMRSPGFLSLMNPDGTQQQIIPTGT
ncbi:MAG TPA: hypothetical protein VFQ76_13095, partial [Longimicrobiaceae bacterium]|nr:hypothetical protein [Longimicrobiaceae bacterium]